MRYGKGRGSFCRQGEVAAQEAWSDVRQVREDPSPTRRVYTKLLQNLVIRSNASCKASVLRAYDILK